MKSVNYIILGLGQLLFKSITIEIIFWLWCIILGGTNGIGQIVGSGLHESKIIEYVFYFLSHCMIDDRMQPLQLRINYISSCCISHSIGQRPIYL